MDEFWFELFPCCTFMWPVESGILSIITLLESLKKMKTTLYSLELKNFHP
jgi:hypothetical protein